MTDETERALRRLPASVREELLRTVAERGWCGDDDGVLHSYDTVAVAVVIQGVDRGIAPLVEALSRIPGVQTIASCQGRPHSLYETRAHVSWRDLFEPAAPWIARAAERAGVVYEDRGGEIWLAPRDVRPLARALNDLLDEAEWGNP